jgi:succinylglutamate desuccinylase
MTNKDFIKLTGKYAGPTSIILAGVHGDEVCGINAINELLPSLQLNKGSLIIGLGNLLAIKKNVRYIEVNLNRVFKDGKLLSKKEKMSYEYRRSRVIKKYLMQADALLDIHSSHTPNSPAFAICEKNGLNIARYLPVKYITGGFDKVEPGGTDYYMNSNGKIGICVECGYTNDSLSTKNAIQSIIAFLAARKHIKNNNKFQGQSFFNVYYLYKTKTKKFKLQKKFNDFEKVFKNQIIGKDGKQLIKAQKNGVIIFARNSNKIGADGFLLGIKKKA